MSWRGREDGKEIRLKGGKKSLKGRKMLKEEAGSKSRWGGLDVSRQTQWNGMGKWVVEVPLSAGSKAVISK